MIEFINTNLQVLLMGGALLIGATIAMTGWGLRYDDENESHVTYNVARFWRAVTVGGGLFVLAAAIAFVPAGHRGVVFDQGSGVDQAERNEGIVITVPFWQRVHNMDVRTQVFEYESFVQTKDLQEVTLPIAVNYHVQPDSATQIYQEVGNDYETVILLPAAFQASTQASGAIEAESIAQSRAALAADIAEIMSERLSAQGIVVESVSVKDAVFDAQFITSVKNKVIASQNAAEEFIRISEAESVAEQARKKASGLADAEALGGDGSRRAIDAIARALGFTPAQYLEYLRLTVWNGQLPATLLGADQDVIIGLP